MTFKLGNSLTLPDRLPTMKVGLVGRTGSGKTNTAVVLAEQMIARSLPIAIIDPQGDWWGLRSHFPIAILGGEHGDVPLESTGGAIAADFVINERIPVLLDLFTMGEGEMVRFATDFAKRLWTKNREALHVFLDEADLFAPQRSMGTDKSKCLSAWQNVCRRGRSRGIGLTMITQRSAVINKDLLTQADPMIIHRLTAPQDLAAVEDYLKYHGVTPAGRLSVIARVSKLEIGSALVLSPGELDIQPTIINVPRRKSFDSGATPESGKALKTPKQVADVDLDALKHAMSETIERAKDNDPKELRNRIRELESKLKQSDHAVDPDAVANAVNKAVSERDREWKRAIQEHETIIGALKGRMDKAAALLSVNGEATPKSVIPEPAKVFTKQVKQNPKPISKTVYQKGKGEHISLPKGEAIILAAVAQYESAGADRTQLTILTDYKRSSRDAYIQRLKERGFVETNGASVFATQAGIDALGPNFEPLPTGDALREVWRNRLTGGERQIFELLEMGGTVVCSREHISEQLEYARSSRDAYVQRLKARKIVTVSRDGIALVPALFD